MTIEVTYNVTDIYISSEVSPIYIDVNYQTNGGGAVWGNITGTLSNQTDLQTSLNTKLDESTIDGGSEGQILTKNSATDFDFAWIDNYAKYMATNVRNQTGSTIDAFKVVYISGSTGNKPLITLSDADTEVTSSKTYGVTKQSIANNGTGDVVTAGELSGIDTSAFTEGDKLWLSSTPGGVVTTPPAEPAHTVFIGTVIRSHPTLGIVDVNIQNGYELTELHGVQITSETNNQGLFYDGTSSLWVNKSIPTVLGYTPEQPLTFSSPLSRLVNAVSIPAATSSVNGYLSSTDWSTFNGKENALTFSSPLSRSTNTISIPEATSSVSGYLSSTDWNTFNNKQNALTNPITGTGTNGQVAYWNGTNTQTGSATLTYTPTSALLVNNSVTAATSIARGVNFTPTLVASANNDVLVGIDVNPTFTNGAFTGVSNFALRLQTASASNAWNLYASGTANNYMAGSLGIGGVTLSNITLRLEKNITGGTVAFNMGAFGTVQSDVTSQVRYIGTSLNTAAAAFTLGAAYHYFAEQGTIGAGSSITSQYGFFVNSTLVGATNNFGFYGNIASGTNRWNLYMNGTANNYMAGSLGIGSTSLSAYNLRIGKSLTGGTGITSIQADGTIQSDVTSDAVYFRTSINTAASVFTIARLYHFSALQNAFGSGSIVTNQYGYHVGSSLTGATNNYGFFGDIASGANRWNLYMNGTASNYLAGKLLVGTTTDAGYTAADFNGTVRVQGIITVNSSSTDSAYIYNAFTSATQNNIRIGSSSVFTSISAIRPSANFETHLAFNTSASGAATQLEVFRATSTQSVLIGTTTDTASAILNVSSTTKGFLPPRMTTTQKNAITSPVAGLVVYDTTLNKLCVYTTAWETITSI